MKTYANKSGKNSLYPAADIAIQRQGNMSASFTDNRPEAIAQRKLYQSVNIQSYKAPVQRIMNKMGVSREEYQLKCRSTVYLYAEYNGNTLGIFETSSVNHAEENLIATIREQDLRDGALIVYLFVYLSTSPCSSTFGTRDDGRDGCQERLEALASERGINVEVHADHLYQNQAVGRMERENDFPTAYSSFSAAATSEIPMSVSRLPRAFASATALIDTTTSGPVVQLIKKLNMKTPLSQKQVKISNTITHNSVNKQTQPNLASFTDNRPEAVTQRKLQEAADSSIQVAQVKALQNIADNHTAITIQQKKNNTGLPDNLKSGVESLSGISMDDVKVHYNSARPSQLQAHAYAQGTDIHLAPGQEKHLPHEAWHVVQQKQGRVRPTLQMKIGVNINDDNGLENEADVMGNRAMQFRGNTTNPLIVKKQTGYMPLQRKGWTWNAARGLWIPDIGGYYPQPTIQAGADGARLITGDVDTSDVADPANRPTEGGMTEGEARTIAGCNGWRLDNTKFTCSDSAHTPKGKVYTDGSTFYGADNTGHVGWGFKVWTRAKGNQLKYEGNCVWDGNRWKHINR